MANTYVLIASTTVGSGGASSIDFTSIPATYTDLLFKFSGRVDTSAVTSLDLKPNGATTSFSSKILEGTGSAVSGFSDTSGFIADINGTAATANTFTNTEFYIPNYAGSNYKSVSIDGVTENNATAAYAVLSAYLWSNTAAINRLTLTARSGGNFVQYSTAYLYGIKSS